MSAAAPMLGVSACLVNADGTVLLVERGKPPFEGLLSLPGGRVEFGERLHDAIRREVKEETGLAVAGLAFHRLHEVIAADRHAVIAVFVGRVLPGAEPAASDDAARLLFATVDEVDRLEAEGRTTPGLAGIVRSALAVTVNSGSAG